MRPLSLTQSSALSDRTRTLGNSRRHSVRRSPAHTLRVDTATNRYEHSLTAQVGHPEQLLGVSASAIRGLPQPRVEQRDIASLPAGSGRTAAGGLRELDLNALNAPVEAVTGVGISSTVSAPMRQIRSTGHRAAALRLPPVPMAGGWRNPAVRRARGRIH